MNVARQIFQLIFQIIRQINSLLPFFTGKTINPFVTAGISVNLGRNIRWMTSAEYQYNYKKEYKGIKIENRNQDYSLNTGLQFEFLKKQKKYYQYLGEF